MSKLYNFNSAFPLIEQLYGVEADVNNFEDIALNGWELIGNKHTRLYKYEGKTDNLELKLPCNVDIIESVHIPISDAQFTTNTDTFGDSTNVLIEDYIDVWKGMDNPFNQKGKLVKYKQGDNSLYFSRDYDKVIVIYHGIIVDDSDGLPLLNAKEVRAIASYVAYMEYYKEGLKKRNGDIINISQTLKEEWLRRCNAARISEHLTQNDMDAILDVKYRWDRKQYGKSFIPII